MDDGGALHNISNREWSRSEPFQEIGSEDKIHNAMDYITEQSYLYLIELCPWKNGKLQSKNKVGFYPDFGFKEP